MTEIRRAKTVEEVVAAQHLFDGPARRTASEKFLAGEENHLLIAYEDGEPAGMITGTEVTHPDKGTEMFLNELDVSPDYQRRGIGRDLVDALAGLARERGCRGMWVGVETDNEAALATYAAAGAANEGPFIMQSWTFED
ncbi:GNAT family N-acetyltransferase [Amycolatopsis thailandensis]|uniref:GNAT family N-acetyltransferase n=1 Tax=Amycolatopsis thailandensis TaxID=589330 RepID=A0A229SGJ6_9PSEU|nr:GNAT family N-acetyltransferase [Amycolatopsis thailandensis]OXM58006.1 GNAT family N-acetyltransferase [Amycolatopsis thailandensis]